MLAATHRVSSSGSLLGGERGTRAVRPLKGAHTILSRQQRGSSKFVVRAGAATGQEATAPQRFDVRNQDIR